MSIKSDELKSYAVNYPYPIARIVEKYLKVSYDLISDKHSILCDIFEALSKFNAILIVKLLLKKPNVFSAVFPGGVDFLKHPSLGHWISLLRNVSRTNEERPELIEKICTWYNGGVKTNEITEAFKSLPEVKFNKGPSVNESIINALVTYRNKVWKGHGAVKIDEIDLKARVDALEILLFHLFRSIDFYDELQLVYINEVKLPSPGVFEARATSLMGISNESVSIKSNEAFVQGEVYYIDNKKEERNDISLSPFLEWQKDASNKLNFYFFNDAQRSKIEYLCYYDGSFYYHKELKKDFEEILNVSLEESSDQYEYIQHNFNKEERSHKSLELFTQGKILSGDGKYEEALIVFETALEWYKEPNLMLERCKMLEKLDEDKSYIISLLEDALELDSKNEEIIDMRDRLSGIRDDGNHDIDKKNELIDYSSYDTYRSHIFSYFEFIVPRKIRGHAHLFLWGIIMLFNISLTAILAYIDYDYFINYIPAVIFISITETLLLFVAPKLKNYYVSIFYQLFSQVDSMKLERFSEWYKKNLFALFGHFLETTQGDIIVDEEKERPYFVAVLFIIIIWNIAAIVMQALYTLPLLIAIIQFFHGFVFWTTIFITLRTMVMATTLVFSFSKFSLNPAISEANNQGFIALLDGFIKFIFLFAIFWVFFWLYFAIVCIDPFFTDLLGVILAWIMAASWTLMTPVNISGALKEARNHCLVKYQTHTIDAFNGFIKDPSENGKEKLYWLLSSEKELKALIGKGIPFKYLSVIILVNIWVIFWGLVYTLYRLGSLDAYINLLF